MAKLQRNQKEKQFLCHVGLLGVVCRENGAEDQGSYYFLFFLGGAELCLEPRFEPRPELCTDAFLFRLILRLCSSSSS